MQGYSISCLNDYDIVLVAKLSKEIGPAWWDFKSKLLSFKHQQKHITRQGLFTQDTTYISRKELKKTLRQALALAVLHLAENVNKEMQAHLLDWQQTQLEQFLLRYHNLFEVPKGLPHPKI